MSGKRPLAHAHEASSACDATWERAMDLLSPEFEFMDPNPDVHLLFQEYNALFFYGKLGGCEVKWSKRMTLCAGLCSFQPSSGFCSIRLSEPLLKLRPRSDLINTLLHEMIHAFIFVYSPVRDRDDHGPVFQSHMKRINQTAGTMITVYHTFHDEVDTYRQHWWQCDGSCRRKPPYFGLVKRAMNRPPGPLDLWWEDHQKTCGGTYIKVKDPPGFKEKQEKKLLRQQQKKEKAKAAPSVKNFFPAAASETPDNGDQPTHPPTKKKHKVAKPENGTTKKKDEPTWLDGMRKPDASTEDPHVDSKILKPEPSSYSFAIPENAMVVAGDDGEFFLVGDVGAMLQFNQQQPPHLLMQGSQSMRNGGLVDLTETDDENVTSERATTLGGPQSGQCLSVRSAERKPAVEVEIIEID